MAQKQLDADEISLWKKVAQTVTPILRQRFISPNVEAQPSPTPPPKSAKAFATTSPPKKHLKPAPQPKPTLKPADLDRNGYGGISKSDAKAIKSGQVRPSQQIDLHGLNQQQAHTELKHFIQTAAQQGHRHVLVITGIGRTTHKSTTAKEGAKKGIIKTRLPQWLGEKPLADIVIAYCIAKPKDGGEGAFYLKLRI